MNTLKIYNIIAVILLFILGFWIQELRKELQETNVLLEQCSDRYYQEIGKDKPSDDLPGFDFYSIRN